LHGHGLRDDVANDDLTVGIHPPADGQDRPDERRIADERLVKAAGGGRPVTGADKVVSGVPIQGRVGAVQRQRHPQAGRSGPGIVPVGHNLGHRGPVPIAPRMQAQRPRQVSLGVGRGRPAPVEAVDDAERVPSLGIERVQLRLSLRRRSIGFGCIRDLGQKQQQRHGQQAQQ